MKLSMAQPLGMPRCVHGYNSSLRRSHLRTPSPENRGGQRALGTGLTILYLYLLCRLLLSDSAIYSPGSSIVDSKIEPKEQSDNQTIKQIMVSIHRGFLSCFLISLGTISLGYPAVIVASTLAKPSFLKYMGLGDENGIYPHKQDMAGTITSLFQVSHPFHLAI